MLAQGESMALALGISQGGLEVYMHAIVQKLRSALSQTGVR